MVDSTGARPVTILGRMLYAHRSIVATARAIRNVGGLEGAVGGYRSGILVWGWGMGSQDFASSHHLIPYSSTPAIPTFFVVPVIVR